MGIRIGTLGFAVAALAVASVHRVEVGSADFTAEIETLGSPWPVQVLRSGATSVEVRADASRMPRGNYAALLRIVRWANGESSQLVVPIRSGDAPATAATATQDEDGRLTLAGEFPVEGTHAVVGEPVSRLADMEVLVDGERAGLLLVAPDRIVTATREPGQVLVVAYRGVNDTLLVEAAPAVAPIAPSASTDRAATLRITLSTAPETFIPIRYQWFPAIGGESTLLTRESSTVSGNGWNVALDSETDYLFHALPNALGRVDSRYSLRTVTRPGSAQPAVDFESRAGGLVFRPSADAAYVFQFGLDHLLTLGTAATGASIYLPEGAPVAITGSCPQGQNFSRFDMESITAPARTYAAGTPLSSNPSSFRLDRPTRVGLTCAPAVSGPVRLTLQVDPPGVGLRGRIGTSGVFAVAPVSQNVQSGTQATIAVEDPQVSEGVGYRFTSWSTGAQTTTTTVTPASEQTVTARFQLTCYELNISVNPPSSSGTITRNPASGVAGFPANNCYAPGTQVTVTAAPAAMFMNWTGISGTGPSATVTMNNPVTGTANFRGNVNLTVQTSPTGLQASIGGGGAQTAPVTQQVQSGQPVTVSVPDFQMLGGTGYRFTGWSTGATTTSASVTPNANMTVTANFQAACHTLTTSVSPSGGGTITRVPASGVAGFPSDCYAPGTRVTLTANAASGFLFASWSGFGKSGPTVVVTVTAPASYTASFLAVPALDFSYVSRSNASGIATVTMRVTNTGGSTAFTVRVTSVAGPPNGPYIGTTPPFTVASSLAAGASATFSLPFRTGTAPFSFTIGGNASNAAAVSETISVP